MMSLTFGLFTQVSGSGPLGPLVDKKLYHSPSVQYDNILLKFAIQCFTVKV